MPETTDSFFTSKDNEWFQPTSHTRGPWNVNHCHAGPPTGLIARALEHRLPEQRLTRLTVELTRPIPFDGFQIATETQRSGRIVSTTRATLFDSAGKACVTASGLHMTAQPETDFPTVPAQPRKASEAKVGGFPISRTLHGEPAFNGTGVVVKYPAGESSAPGPTTAWMRTVPLLPDETPSPFQRICPLADCGNAFSRNAEPWDVNFINPDLTLLLHRDPRGEWLGTQACGYWESNGIGMADALLFDEHGVVGRAMQTLLLQAAAPAT